MFKSNKYFKNKHLIIKDVVNKNINSGFSRQDSIIDGQSYYYSAFKRGDNLINIGTYYPIQQ